MHNLKLKYGCNPQQQKARIYRKEGELPLTVLNGNPGYINLLDALNGWQLVSALERTLGMSAAASFKHVSPAGVAVGLPLSLEERKMYFVGEGEQLSELATAYVRARGADRMSSFGDFVSLSSTCDESTARCIAREVSDGVIAPGYTEQALALLREKRKGSYTVLEIDADYVPDPVEKREVFGITFEQERSSLILDESVLKPVVTERADLPQEAKVDLIVALTALQYTQSNSVCYAKRGQSIGVGAGQQSRIHCTRLAGEKADFWHLRQHERVLSLPFLPKLSRNAKDNAVESYLRNELDNNQGWKGFFMQKPEPFTPKEQSLYLKGMQEVSLASDAFFPFRDNIDRAQQSGVRYIVQSGGSLRDDEVIEACNGHGIVMVANGIRLFHH
jgi:AICAR transformylase/IMP cyclohydrolase PurH